MDLIRFWDELMDGTSVTYSTTVPVDGRSIILTSICLLSTLTSPITKNDSLNQKDHPNSVLNLLNAGRLDPRFSTYILYIRHSYGQRLRYCTTMIIILRYRTWIVIYLCSVLLFLFFFPHPSSTIPPFLPLKICTGFSAPSNLLHLRTRGMRRQWFLDATDAHAHTHIREDHFGHRLLQLFFFYLLLIPVEHSTRAGA
ncbi:hypothetical protein HOY80DRAFT_960634 [Tuber brumale]|nr:hypothetical protein HOY80DRAFT_960634 [Tuber brumale]